MIFPNVPYPYGLRWADAPDKFKAAITDRPDGSRKLQFHIFVGISYRIVGHDQPRITFRSFSVLNAPVSPTGLAIPDDGSMIDLPSDSFISGEVD
ncbi:MAG: hypothetical protein WB760_06865 [Xanthobacteraceae bacterium]